MKISQAVTELLDVLEKNLIKGYKLEAKKEGKIILTKYTFL